MRTLLALVLLVLSTPSGFAQDAAPAHKPKPFTITLFGELLPSSELDGSSTEFGSLKSGVAVGALVPLVDREQILRLGFTGMHRSYDWENVNPDPFDSASTHGQLQAAYINRASRDLFWNIFGTVASGTESGADFGDSIALGAGAGVGFVIDEDLSVGLGIGVQDRLEDDPFVYPIPLVKWQIAEDWRLFTSDHLDSGVSLGWRTSPEIELDLTAGIDFYQFRLDDSGALPGGAVFDQRNRIGLGFNWSLAEETTLRLAVGTFLGQEYEVTSANGASLATFDVEDGPYFLAALSFAF